MTDKTSPERDPELEQLLPWYVNGTLSEAERQRVESYLESSAEARQELAFLEGLRGRVKDMDYGNTPGEMGLKRLQREIARDRPAAHHAARTAPGWWRPAAIAASLVIAIQAGILMQTLTGGGDIVPAGGEIEGVVLQASFAPDATEAEIRALLQAVDGSLVDGPGEIAVYRIRLNDVDPEDAAAIERALAALAARSDIVTHVGRE